MSIYASTRAMYEVLMYQMIDKIQNGEDYKKDLTVLLNCYNNASADCEKMLTKIQELTNE